MKFSSFQDQFVEQRTMKQNHKLRELYVTPKIGRFLSLSRYHRFKQAINAWPRLHRQMHLPKNKIAPKDWWIRRVVLLMAPNDATNVPTSGSNKKERSIKLRPDYSTYLN